ncbi:OB-fold nucleic acid binding domain-containing protein [Psychrosphaera sp. F3M07]|uniref:OB-fold nucleic acid binding domain-containing protein n=1 Tax=Psychrosphaera sp. F3M07 TaxID=2841560 RepID=UPI001C0997BE|nr:OB-fold nucleic acid binding domain-containing protein [Psychrosphaera sp. F3M07]MBU2919621.1 OB-fold nucleic acid binding domain-containing protein [Psychrosphaera sp. F3M07]
MKINNSIQPCLNDATNFMRFKGIYFLVGFVARVDKHGQPYWELTLTDHKASVIAYCFDEQNFFSKLQPQQLVQLEVAKTSIGAKQFFRVVLAESAAKDSLIANYGHLKWVAM